MCRFNRETCQKIIDINHKKQVSAKKLFIYPNAIITNLKGGEIQIIQSGGKRGAIGGDVNGYVKRVCADQRIPTWCGYLDTLIT